MCGRYTVTLSGRTLAEVFAAEPRLEHSPRFNVAPTQPAPIVRPAADGGRELVAARWGLIPSWAKDASIAARLINARAETVVDRPSFRSAFRSRRCLVPADGFFEWRRTEWGKQPFHLRFTDRRPFAFAGVWERWRPDSGDVVDSFTILTARPNELVATIHDRMPVILPPNAWEAWLTATGPVKELHDLLVPCPSDGMEAIPVSTRVNDPRHDDPTCLARTPA